MGDLVRAGQLVRLVEGTAGQPAGGDVAIEREIDARRLFERVRDGEHEQQRQQQHRRRGGERHRPPVEDVDPSRHHVRDGSRRAGTADRIPSTLPR